MDEHLLIIKNNVVIIKTTILKVVTDMCLAREIDGDFIPKILREIADEWDEEYKKQSEEEKIK